MDDLQTWQQGVRLIRALPEKLPPDKRLTLSGLMDQYRSFKRVLAASIQMHDSDALCCLCAGQCCMNGKYRINAFDLLALCCSDLDLTPNFSHKPLCPYGGEKGCLMEPEYRPADCVIFICDSIDDKLSSVVRMELETAEQKLRECLQDASVLLETQLATPFLLWTEKQLVPVTNQRE